MTGDTTKQAETARQIRERLEETGEFSKMRAMIVNAALQSLMRDQSAEAKEKLFYPSQALAEAKGCPDGRQALAAMYTYMQQLGLQYTASVLALETGIPADELVSDGNGGSATALLSTIGAKVAATTAAGHPQPVTSVPAPTTASTKPKPTASSPSSSPSGSSAASSIKSEGEEPPQPGAEDSTYYIAKWKKKSFVRVGQVSGQQVQIEYLTDCTVMVLDPLDSMTVDDCEGGQLIIAACEGSVFLRNCKNMTVHVACKQLRTRDCEHVDLHIFTTTDPVVEMSHHITFRPFHLRLPNLSKSFKEARLDPAVNRFVHVYDFTKDEASLPKPHFSVEYPCPTVAMEDRGGDYGTPECPPQIEDLLTGKLLPAASSESGQNKSYDIKTGSAAWAAAAAAAVQPTAKEEGSDVEEEVEEEEPVVTDEEDEEKSKALPVPSAGSRPPVAPVPVPTTGAATLGGLDDQEYSSFDESSESSEKDDKYEVDEDDDDF